MKTSTTSRWLLGLGLLALSPAALAAQNDTGQPVGQEDNTSYGTTSAEFLLLGAGARGAALGGSFAAIATEFNTGHEIWLTRGRLVDAMRASYALPGIFPPVLLDGR